MKSAADFSEHVCDPGIRFVVEPSGTVLTPQERAQLQDLRPAGIMLRKRNFCHELPYSEWFLAYQNLIADCRQAIGRTNIIVSVDHEGGAVHRFPAPITRFPYPATYGSIPDAVFEVASAMGEELSALGVNLSYSPVADIHSNPQNPVIHERAFGTTAESVINAAIACARGLRQHGVTPCAKHFPGHGDTATDSHYAVPVVERDKLELGRRELAPFKALIAAGIEIIMTAHVMVPAFDRDNQATISKALLTDLLRGQLGFEGLTIADALGMRGIHGVVTAGSFPVRAHLAGLDLFLVAGDTVSIGDALTLRSQLMQALASEEIDLASELATEQRIEAFLGSLAQHEVKQLSPETLARHATLASQLAANAPWSKFQFHPAGFE